MYSTFTAPQGEDYGNRNLTGKGGRMDVYKECPFVVDTKCIITSLGGHSNRYCVGVKCPLYDTQRTVNEILERVEAMEAKLKEVSHEGQGG
jgi:hypothetical protein